MKQSSINSQKKQHKGIPQCHSCGILIGREYIEKKPYRVGRFILCGQCRQILEKQGHVELDGRHPVKGIGEVCSWLYPDGSTRKMRIRLKPRIAFIPLDQAKEEAIVK